MNTKQAKFSRRDASGKLFVDCSECTRAGNGPDPDKCAPGGHIKSGRRGGCFLGALIEGLEVAHEVTKP